MKIRKFTAPSVPLALRQVHDELGDRAVILNTRTLPAGGDPSGRVEVTAALDEEVLAGTSAGSRREASAVAAGRAPRAERADLLGRVYGRSQPGNDVPAQPLAPRPPVRPIDRPMNRPADRLVDRPGPAQKMSGPRWQQDGQSPRVEERHIRSAADWLASLPAVNRGDRHHGLQHDPTVAAAEDLPAPAPQVAADAAVPASLRDTHVVDESAVVGQLRQLEEAVHRMASQTVGFQLPRELARLGERLRRTGLAEPHVQRCQQMIMSQLNAEQLEDQATVARVASECLVGTLPASKEIRVGRERRVVALVGPSGAGKTTAAARIAAGFVRRRQQRGKDRPGEVVLVSADARRVGALAQSQAFADLIHVPLETAYDEHEMAAAVQAHPTSRLMLIDAGGCGPHERSEAEHLRRMLEAARVDEVHVVVDGLMGVDHIIEAARCWQRQDGASVRLMVTKMDQSVRPGAIVSAAIDAGLPLSYLTTSAAVPGGIRPGDLKPWIDWMVGLSPRPFTESDA